MMANYSISVEAFPRDSVETAGRPVSTNEQSSAAPVRPSLIGEIVYEAIREAGAASFLHADEIDIVVRIRRTF